MILKQVSDRLELPFDLREEKIMQYIDATTGYEEKSIDTLLREYLATIRNFQKSDGGFSFWKDDTASNISLTIGLLHSWSRMQAIGYTLDEDTL